MAVRPLVKQTIAKTQLEVAEKLDDLLNQNNIEADSILDIEVTRFGANQFLILAIYYGIYVFWTQLGLAVSAVRGLAVKRELADGVGLTTAMVYQQGPVRKAGTGLVTVLTRGLYTGNRILSSLVGLNVDEDRDVACSRSTADLQVGLACDVGYTHVSP